MTSAWYLLRFFQVVAPVSRITMMAFAVLGCAAGAKIVMDPAGAAGALVPVLVLQLFATSTGFAVPARRGYYDLLLTRADGRLRIAAAQWLTSILPGVLTCAAVGLVEAIVTGGTGVAGRASGTLVALFLVSTLPWALTVPLPRFAGAIGWLLAFVAAAAFVPTGRSAGGGWTFADTAGLDEWGAGVVLFPLGLIGRSAGAVDGVTAALLLALLAMVMALAWIHQADFGLESAQ